MRLIPPKSELHSCKNEMGPELSQKERAAKSTSFISM